MTQAISPAIITSQNTPHLALEKLVSRYLEHPFQRPISHHTQKTFEVVWPYLAQDQPLILDTGCGVGESTSALAAAFPQALVLGLDKSSHRLKKHQPIADQSPGNYLLLQAELVDFWRLLHQHQIWPQAQYFFYPNPWPKAKHVKRRWHAHPIIPYILDLGGYFEVRSNWELYIQEFAAVVAYLTGVQFPVERYLPEEPFTPFERKYHKSQHNLYRTFGKLPTGSIWP